MSIEHPYLRGWFALQDGRNINVNHIVWFQSGTQEIFTEHNEIQEQPTIKLFLSNGATIALDDPADRERFTKLVGTIDGPT